MAGINERLIDDNAKFFEGEDLINGTITSGYIRTGAGGQLGATKIYVRASDAVTIADTTTLVFGVNEADDATGTNATAMGSFTITASGATTYSAGYNIWEFIIPRTASKEFTNITITSNDAAVAGSVDAFCSSPVGFTNV